MRNVLNALNLMQFIKHFIICIFVSSPLVLPVSFRPRESLARRVIFFLTCDSPAAITLIKIFLSFDVPARVLQSVWQSTKNFLFGSATFFFSFFGCAGARDSDCGHVCFGWFLFFATLGTLYTYFNQWR